uniref:Ubiquitin carboxyl-terminal hydrolase MINDY-4 n=1 Tax=Sphaerodactylus townsendi TaxID=933632 RepID=A0ACB8FX65_9SAUR
MVFEKKTKLDLHRILFSFRIRGDFDVITNQLIGAHGYCTQELVNLLLTGKAVSNVFNDVVELDSGNGNTTALKGISGRSDIGLLSLFEHYDVCQVGCYLKTPKFPIWLVCSESHFSVLFGTRKDLLGDWKTERRFDLYYYDGLANQQEDIRLTIDTSQPYLEDPESDLIPPLEHCIRTK